MHVLLFGNEQSEHLVMRFTFPAPEKQGWVEAEVTIVVEGFRGAIDVGFELDDLLKFERELASVYATLGGRAEFTHRDGQLTFSIEGNGRGGIVLKGRAFARPTYGNALEFAAELDQTFLAEPLAVLQALSAGEVKVGV